MGTKGEKATSKGRLVTELLVSKLDVIDKISSKKMFGGHGIFRQGKMFALVNSRGIVHFRTNDSSYKKYEAQGFEKHRRMPYHAVPDKVFDNPETLLDWAKEAIALSKNNTR
ncbi:hypothetical protein GTQ34_06785 [Muricauda sp. JGD-17]|uniref:TfoX N-terminal domain-containing protein n=1 Tax=Flagellimonas ochracea TaxID=2696472 RepID=A0A964TB43_9FLAO|nr:TfoX/Sxy family protein [Allomuricauda ochracea]NAY91617.1 hypothetical protein [Allomuricauda ochracea]